MKKSRAVEHRYLDFNCSHAVVPEGLRVGKAGVNGTSTLISAASIDVIVE